ncbi:MAG: MTH938/NDUFAF3 family protein [Candidatus Bathyarchaeia archaeon]
MIDFYDFGTIVINGERYTSDVIIFQDKVKDKWWRSEGHRVAVEDLKEALEAKPQIVVVGTGYSGLMKVSNEVKQHLDNQGIQLVIKKPTTQRKFLINLQNQVKK